MPKKKAAAKVKEESDVVFEYEGEAIVRARVESKDGQTEVAVGRILSRKVVAGAPCYWFMPKETSLPIQYVKEPNILGLA